MGANSVYFTLDCATIPQRGATNTNAFICVWGRGGGDGSQDMNYLTSTQRHAAYPY